VRTELKCPKQHSRVHGLTILNYDYGLQIIGDTVLVQKLSLLLQLANENSVVGVVVGHKVHCKAEKFSSVGEETLAQTTKQRLLRAYQARHKDCTLRHTIGWCGELSKLAPAVRGTQRTMQQSTQDMVQSSPCRSQPASLSVGGSYLISFRAHCSWCGK